jgi:hypothetical protein
MTLKALVNVDKHYSLIDCLAKFFFGKESVEKANVFITHEKLCFDIIDKKEEE